MPPKLIRKITLPVRPFPQKTLTLTLHKETRGISLLDRPVKGGKLKVGFSLRPSDSSLDGEEADRDALYFWLSGFSGEESVYKITFREIAECLA